MALFPRYEGPPLIEQICAVSNMTAAYRQVRANIAAYRRGRSAGPDGVTLRDFDADWPTQMAQLTEELRSNTYRALPAQLVEIPKRGGGARAIAILAMRDRIAQRAVLQVLGPVFDPLFLDCSYGCRPGLSVADALSRVARYAQQGHTWVVDADLADYFASIDQTILLALVRQRVAEPAVLRLIASWLDAGAHTAAATPIDPSPAASLVSRGVTALRGLLDGAAPPPAPLADPYATAAWEHPGDGWVSPYAGAPVGGYRNSPINTLWSAFLLARPLIEGSRRVLPYLRRIGGQRAMIAGGVAAGALAAYELAQRWQPLRPRGTVQGGPLSPLLANIYLHPFDIALTSQGLRLVRFMDDFVVLCATRADAERALVLIERQLTALRLRLNPAKTSIRDYDEGIDFLGSSLAPRRRGPTLEQGLESFIDAQRALREAMQQARAGARRARRRVGRRARPGKK